jgi:hypothetical protein
MNDGNGTAGGKSKKKPNNYMPLIELLSRSDLMIITVHANPQNAHTHATAHTAHDGIC